MPAARNKERILWSGPHAAIRGEFTLSGPARQAPGLWLAPSPMARDQTILALSRLGQDSNVGNSVCCWDELWGRLLTESAADRAPSAASPIAIRTLVQEAIRIATDRDEVGDLAAMLEFPGYRRRLLARFSAWTSAELPRGLDSPPSTAIDPREWVLFNGYRDLLSELGMVDEAGLAVWASKHLVRARPAFFDRFGQVTFLDFEPSSPAQWRVLEHAVQRTPSVHAMIPFESDPERAELYEAVGNSRERLMTLGFAEKRVECDLWRPAGLRAAESLLFRDGPESGSSRRPAIANAAGLTIRGAPQGDGSARVLAREVRRILDQGIDPEDVLVLFRQWSPQAELALETLRAWGIPAWSEPSSMLDGDSAVAALLLAMRIPNEDWETDLLVRLLRHGQVRPTHRGSDPTALVTAASAIKASRVFRGGPDLILKALGRAAADPHLKDPQRKRADSSREVVSWILGVLERAVRRRGWFGQVERLLELAGSLGLGRSPQARRALDQLRDALEERGDLVDRLRRDEPDRPMTWAEFAREVGRIVAETPLDGPFAPGVGCVRLAFVDEARGVRAKFILLADLAEGAFPAREAVEPFLAVKPGQAPVALARLGFSREALRFLGVLGSAELGVTLLYPTTDAKGQEVLRAGFLDDLLALLTPEADRICHESHSRFHPALVDNPELAIAPADRRVRAIARARELGDAAALADLPATAEEHKAMEGVAAALTVSKGRGYKTPFGEFDGLLRDGAAILSVGDRFNRDFLFSPSQLETYIGCPFQFFTKYVMKLDVRDDRDELGEDFTERGSRIHDMLERLEGYRKSLSGRMESEQIEKIAINSVLAIEIADPTGVDLGLRKIEDLRLQRVLKRYSLQLSDYEANSPSKPIPLAFEVKFGGEADEDMEEVAYPALQIGPEDRGVKLQGMIDRIDLVETPQGPAFRIIDYKSGKGPTAADVKSGHMLQLPLYALAVERHILADGGKALLDVGYWGLKKDGYRSIRFDQWQADQAVLESYVVEVVGKLRDGVFPVSSRQAGCEGFCDFRTICRVRQVRSARKEPGDAIVPAIALAASAVRIKNKSRTKEADLPGVVRVEPLSPDPQGEG
jgi:hypothetical protein